LLACRALFGQGAGTAMGILCAVSGAGAWAVVAQQATTSTVGGLALLLGARWTPAFICRWSAVRDMLRVGGPLAISTLVLHGRYRLFALLIGGTAGAAALGEANLAFRLVDTVRELAFAALWRLMLPGMAEQQNDKAALRESIDRWLSAIGFYFFPLCAGMLVTVQPLTTLALGASWAPSGQAAAPLILLTIWLALGFPAGAAAVARGAPQFALRGNVASCIALALCVPLLHPTTAMSAAAIWVVTQAAVTPYTMWKHARLLGATIWSTMRAGLSALCLAGIATSAALAIPNALHMPDQPASLIAARILIGAAVWLPGAALLMRCRLPEFVLLRWASRGSAA
jgi:PST family polysaccharide transporter